jgi:hypothetical protein
MGLQEQQQQQQTHVVSRSTPSYGSPDILMCRSVCFHCQLAAGHADMHATVACAHRVTCAGRVQLCAVFFSHCKPYPWVLLHSSLTTVMEPCTMAWMSLMCWGHSWLPMNAADSAEGQTQMLPSLIRLSKLTTSSFSAGSSSSAVCGEVTHV